MDMKDSMPTDKNSKEYLTLQRDGGRLVMLAFAIFTLINLTLLLLGTGKFFLFSGAMPYFLCMLTIAYDGGVVGGYTMGAMCFAAAMLVLYVLAWVNSKKANGWLVLALVLTIADLIALLGASIALQMVEAKIMDLVIHGFLLWEVIQALRANTKLEKQTPGGRLKKHRGK